MSSFLTAFLLVSDVPSASFTGPVARRMYDRAMGSSEITPSVFWPRSLRIMARMISADRGKSGVSVVSPQKPVSRIE